MSTAIQEDLAGIAVIKHYTLEAERAAGVSRLNDEYLAPVAGARARPRRR